MKRLTVYAWIGTAVLVLSACRKPPERPVKGRGGSALPKGSDDPNSVPKVGGDVANGQTPDQYGPNLRCDASETHRGLRAWRRLSNIEVKNTVLDVFGLKDVDFSQFPADIPKKEAFDTINVESNHINETRFSGYENFSKSLAAKADLAKIFPCLNEGPSCIQKQLPALLASAWRRPANDGEVNDLHNLYLGMTKEDGLNPETAARAIIQAVVLSHNFLYRSELGVIQADNGFKLSDWELASALSYTLWRRPPHDELKNLASAGELSKGDIRAIATKMMDAPQAKEAWKDFAAQWLDTGKIATTQKLDQTFTQNVKDKLVDEVRGLMTTVMFDAPEKTYKALLTTDYTIADPALDFIYNSKSSGGKTLYAEPERRGILGQAGFLASHAAPEYPNPILRGVFVAERLLCVHFANPPPTMPPPRKEGKSNAEIFRSHNSPACAGCHTMIDNLGFTFENFDTLGKFRTTDAGKPIDTKGKLPIDGVEVPINGPADMFNAIANSKQGQLCFVREAFRYGFGRTEFFPRPLPLLTTEKPKLSAQAELDRCQIEGAAAEMLKKGGDLKTAIIEFVSSPAFKLRLKGVVEVEH